MDFLETGGLISQHEQARRDAKETLTYQSPSQDIYVKTAEKNLLKMEEKDIAEEEIKVQTGLQEGLLAKVFDSSLEYANSYKKNLTNDQLYTLYLDTAQGTKAIPMNKLKFAQMFDLFDEQKQRYPGDKAPPLPQQLDPATEDFNQVTSDLDAFNISSSGFGGK